MIEAGPFCIQGINAGNDHTAGWEAERDDAPLGVVTLTNRSGGPR